MNLIIKKCYVQIFLFTDICMIFMQRQQAEATTEAIVLQLGAHSQKDIIIFLLG